tara:strand:+ start:162 stop:341 length:180 start_codon:yes stop_codon:yes gene_type:complete
MGIKNISKKNKKIDKTSVQKSVAKNFLESNYEIEQIEGAEAYYSERYGWTLRKSINSKL